MRPIKDGFRFHAHAIKNGIASTVFTSNQLIHLYSNHGLLAEAHKLFDGMRERNVFSWNAIIWAYIKTQNLKQARELFDSAPCKDLVTYNSMLSGYINTDGFETDALNLFLDMQSFNDEARIDEFSLTRMLNLSARLSMEPLGKQLHSYMVKTANNLSGFAVSSLIDMYSKCGCFREVCQVLEGCAGVLDLVSKNAMVAACCREGELEMGLNLFCRDLESNDVVSWNTMISGCVQNGREEKALKLFVHMVDYEVRWNEHTIAGLLSACAGLRSLKLGKEVHGFVLKYKLGTNPFISSGLVDVYCKCGTMKYAELVYATIVTGKAIATTSMIVGHSSQGNMGEARRLFDSVTEKSPIVWTALFSGYAKSQQCEAVFELFSEFRGKEAMTPDALILLSVLSACAAQAALNPGKQIHAYVLRIGIQLDEKLVSAMVDMYSKSGNIKYAEKIFQRVTNRDTVLYNIMISGYAHHGLEKQAIQKFEEMLERGLRPDAVTFIALLSSCRHCGLVELGEKYFVSMVDYNILPEIDHYACMIDLYGRANQLEKAVAFMKRIPVEPDAVILGAFLNACLINRNTELARETEEKLLKIEGYNGARYVQLANVYAAEGKWVEMGRIRRKMRENEVKKFAGCSWVYVESEVHRFTSGDSSHSKAEAIYSILLILTAELNYTAGSKWMSHLEGLFL